MPAFYVLARITSGDGVRQGVVSDVITAATLAAAQTAVANAAARYLEQFPAGSQAQIGLIQMDAVVTVTN